MPNALKQILLGRPLQDKEAGTSGCRTRVALAVFSSDALSSVAYATEEILLALAIGGTASLKAAWPISIAIGPCS